MAELLRDCYEAEDKRKPVASAIGIGMVVYDLVEMLLDVHPVS